ncbi:asparagine synthase (glutamine-hydrolyzing) [Colwellia psychrerythraea]|uniref:asparagine synthase (glutamine-hydrolyzing) n=1 Tax=Colwellia psychrerythraea TaxID=28229 RepID=A0A099KGI5_COLPS|nr:asparagine synthase (glutamine-hydrolyzing) [Colwellia psychrerythraea]KGJ89904.1 asparagine synthase (glutamine-hydrolyzing) [Colwellia psychrerythraea]
MCGISGFYNPRKSTEQSYKTIKNMLNAIVHRGPDDYGIWQHAGLTLGHRRLSIHDLTVAGHQPMQSHDKRFTIVFNGEIYNFEELRAELNITNWQGRSDTEVMLAAISQWGINIALEKFNGMFAFALWDERDKTLILARDRFGEKPLYYYHHNGVFSFASEIKSLEADFDLELKIDRSALTHQLETSYIPAPLSIYTNIKKLPPGCILRFSASASASVESYWDLASNIQSAKKNLFSCENEAIETLEITLKKAVKLRMAADVPLGGFLSGGVDSSLILALMQKQSDKPVNSFSIGFDVPGYNEAEYAKEVASYLGTNHHEQYLSPKDALEIIPKLGAMFDEPFSDASQIPTYLVSAMAKKHVTVCLSGDGGDELFSGYKRYLAIPELWGKIERIPCKSTFTRILRNTPVSVLEKLFFFLKPFAERYGRAGALGPKVKRFGEWLQAQNIDELYLLSMKHWKNADSLIIGGSHSGIWSPKANCLDSQLEGMMYQDSIAYLPGDILTKVDRTAMSVSLEGRIPLLDPNVAEVAWRMPISMKQKGKCGKWALKQVLYKYLPKEMMDRPKMGFGVPIHHWLKVELREWACDLLSENRLSKQGLYHPKLITEKLTKHLTGEENNAAHLWDVLMVQAWLDASPKRVGRL